MLWTAETAGQHPPLAKSFDIIPAKWCPRKTAQAQMSSGLCWECGSLLSWKRRHDTGSQLRNFLDILRKGLFILYLYIALFILAEVLHYSLQNRNAGPTTELQPTYNKDNQKLTGYSVCSTQGNVKARGYWLKQGKEAAGPLHAVGIMWHCLTFTSYPHIKEDFRTFSLHVYLTWEYSGFKQNLRFNSRYNKGNYVFWERC